MNLSSGLPSTTDAEILAIQPPVAGDPIQFVTPDGQLTERGRAAASAWISSSNPEVCFATWCWRRLDHEALALQRQGELGLWLMCLGQEAAQVGSIRALRRTDLVFPSYRGHAAAFSRGVTPAHLLGSGGASRSRLGPAPLPVPLLLACAGRQTLHATGYAMGGSGTARTRS